MFSILSIVILYLPKNIFVAALDAPLPIEILQRYEIYSVNRVLPEYKLDPKIQDGRFPDWAIKNDYLFVKIIFYKDIIMSHKIEMLRIMSRIEDINEFSNCVTISLNPENLYLIAELESVFFIEPIDPPSKPENKTGRSLHRSNAINTDEYTIGRHYDGTGINIMMQDDGIIGPHIDYHGRIDQSNCGGCSTSSSSDHGDHVAGTIMGSGNLDPEAAHDLAIKSLKFNPLPSKMFKVEDEQILKTEVFGKIFPNPIGLAAGFDKSAEAYNSLLRIGFGFVEIGTVTPIKQFGNPKPRIFRLTADKALINRLGFNNDGMEIIKKRIKSEGKQGILGVNIGPNKETKNQKNDFCLGLKNFIDIADYITINISSPNTEGLRDFHDKEKLKDLLLTLNKIKKDNKSNIPLLLKVSPDIEDKYIPEIVDVAINNEISAIILTNTTNSNRGNLVTKIKIEKGGLSGEPLQQISTNMIKKFYKQLNGKIPIIGVGGVNSGKSAYEKIMAGASLLQLYTGFVYRGPSTAKDIKKELIQILKTEGVKNITDVVGKGI